MMQQTDKLNLLNNLLAMRAELINVPILLEANMFFELAGEEFGRKLLLTSGANNVEYCLRPEFTLAIAKKFLQENKNSAAYGYLGPIFRQHENGPKEFIQAGLELLNQENQDDSLTQIFTFALEAIKIYNIKPVIRLGSVELFADILTQINIPKVWRPRILHRFGQKEIINKLLERLADPQQINAGSLPWKKEELIRVVSEQMLNGGISLSASRTPEEIAARYIEKQELANSKVPKEIVFLLQNYLNIRGEAQKTLLDIEYLAKQNNINIEKSLFRIKNHIEKLKDNFSPENIIFDAGFSARLDYYTGIVFQISKENKILASGGEYNRLLERLGADKQINATGCSVWVNRLNALNNFDKTEEFIRV